MPKSNREDNKQEQELPPGVKLLRTLEGDKGVILSVAFDPTGQMLASGSADNTAKLWEVEGGKLLCTFKGHRNPVWSVAFGPKGRTLASASEDNTVKLWDVTSSKLPRTLEGHANSVSTVAFDPSGQTLASGAIENVYASLVVLLCYTQTFTSTNQWQNHARYVMADGSICGFRQEGNGEGELEFVLYFGTNVPKSGQKVFEGLFESFLARRNLTVFRYEMVVCGKCRHPLARTEVRDRLRGSKDFAFCPACGDKLALPKVDEPIQLTQTDQRKVAEQRWFAAHRSRFEQAVFQVMSYVQDQKLKSPECFISYAWGDKDHERWVERNLATDLQKAGINVVLDKWENQRVGASIPRFVERIEVSDRVIMVGTPLYRKKYENKDTTTGYVVAAEVELISNRLLGTDEEKETVLPILLAGEKRSSLPALLHSRVYADFRNERAYFTTAFDLILGLYHIKHEDRAVADLRESLRGEALR
jgi:hypothetical protein